MTHKNSVPVKCSCCHSDKISTNKIHGKLYLICLDCGAKKHFGCVRFKPEDNHDHKYR